MSDHLDSTPPTSATLIRRVQQGDAAGWSRFVYIYSPLVYSWARKAGLQSHDAADVVQEVFRSLTKSLGQFRHDAGSGSFRGWLWAVTRNKIRDHFRNLDGGVQGQGGTEAHLKLQDLPEQRSPDSNSQNDAADPELSRLSRRALEIVKSEFEAGTWQIFWRAAVEGDAANDIAADLGVTKWAVYKAKARVLRRLRQELEDLLD